MWFTMKLYADGKKAKMTSISRVHLYETVNLEARYNLQFCDAAKNERSIKIEREFIWTSIRNTPRENGLKYRWVNKIKMVKWKELYSI